MSSSTRQLIGCLDAGMGHGFEIVNFLQKCQCRSSTDCVLYSSQWMNGLLMKRTTGGVDELCLGFGKREGICWVGLLLPCSESASVVLCFLPTPGTVYSFLSALRRFGQQRWRRGEALGLPLPLASDWTDLK